jgi:6-pyruvoyltetrahydropterin/6-carboxytetrahydropterin synthase
MSFRVVLEKENFKFSCSHFTILGPDSAERLHGHNYYVRVELELLKLDPTLGMAFDFNEVKPLVRDVLEELDERVLLPAKSPFLQIESKTGTVAAVLTIGDRKKRYELPEEDVMLLATVNITSEELSRLIAEKIASGLRAKPAVGQRIRSLAVSVEETRGQSVVYTLTI